MERHSPLSSLKRTFTVTKKPKVVMHEDEIDQFFHHLDKIANLHQQVMVRAIYWLGLRRIEAYELRWDRYDERNQTYTVLGKGGKVETLPVVEEMALWFQRLPRLGRYMCPRNGHDSIRELSADVLRAAWFPIGHVFG